MKTALILNGSPRKNGNTAAALKAAAEGLKKNFQVEYIDVIDLKLQGCINCDSCRKNGGSCVLPDDGNLLMEKAMKSDLILFGSPVYWWGISGQLKLALDKFYCKDEELHRNPKQIGLVSVGAAELSDPEYRLISEQFQCIADFLGWKIVLNRSFAAYGAGDLAGRPAELAALREEASKI